MQNSIKFAQMTRIGTWRVVKLFEEEGFHEKEDNFNLLTVYCLDVFCWFSNRTGKNEYTASI